MGQSEISSSLRAKSLGIGLFALFLVLIWQLRERDLEFIFEADFWPDMIEAWRRFFAGGDASVLPPPIPHPYLDGQFIFYALVASILRALVFVFPSLSTAFPNDASYNLGAAILGNMLAYAIACTLFYAALVRLTGQIAIAVILAIGLFLAPQLIQISIVRVDYLITLPLMAAFYCAVVIVQGHDRLHHGTFLGLSLGFIATLKLNGLFFVILAVLAGISVLGRKRRDIIRVARLTVVIGAAFVLAYAAFMGRYLYYLTPVELVDLYRKTIELLRAWESLPATTSPVYYNVDLMLSHGPEFIALYLASAAAVIWLAVTRRTPELVFLALGLVVFSIAGTVVYKHVRGGYHLLPFFFAAIGVAAAAVLRMRTPLAARLGILSIGVLALASSVARSWMVYEQRAAEMEARPAAIEAVKRAPRQWLANNVEAGATACIHRNSQWTIPPMAGLGIELDATPFNFPYLEPAAMARMEPPDLDRLPVLCDLIILGEWHVSFYDQQMHAIAPELAQRWRSFYRELGERYPPKVFFHPPGGGYVGWAAIYDLRPAKIAVGSRICTDPDNTVSLDGPFSRGEGYAYVRKVPDHRVNDTSSPDGLRLCENDKLLGPEQAIHDSIRKRGRGLFSFWNDYLYFSTSDNSDPNTNGRTYRIVGASRVEPKPSEGKPAANQRSPCATHADSADRITGPFLRNAGHGYVVALPNRAPGDSSSAPQGSNLLLCEDNKPLGPAHTVHEDIRRTGQGAFSHWGKNLFFSTSDNSDPNTNGRTYLVIETSGSRR